MDFQFDRRDLPDSLNPPDQQKRDAVQADYKHKVFDLLQDSGGGVAMTDSLFAAIVGMMLIEGATDPTSAQFTDVFWEVRSESAGTTTDTDGKAVANKDIYQLAADKISNFPGHTKHKKKIVYYQELAYVSRKLIENAEEVPFGDPTFAGQIRVYDDDYVKDGPQGAGGLDIPDLSDQGSSAGPDDIRKANIESVAVISAAHNLEQARLFDVVDRIMETWWNGQLPVGFDKGSKALDDLFWATDGRLSPAARHMQYSRVLGASGGEVSTEVQPNTQFDDLFKRFVASLAEYDRQQRIGDIVGNQRRNALALTAEQVRSSGRNLAANASLYGWGGTQFAARRIADHINKSFAILNSREIQSAYGVDGPWKVVERVAQELGAVPNLVKWRTQAIATQSILKLIAKHSAIWSGSTGKPLFNDSATSQTAAVDRIVTDGFGSLVTELQALVHAAGGGHSGGSGSSSSSGSGSSGGTPVATSTATATVTIVDIDDSDRDELMRQAGNYLAVNGIKDDAVEELSQPAETQYAPSIPSLTSGAPTTNGGGGIDQLRQMVAQGQVPSLDQLKSIVMPTAG